MTETADGGVGNRLPGPLRLRSAGVGVVVGGIALAVLTVLAPFGPAAGVLVAAAVVGAVAWQSDQVLVQLCLGVGAVGAIGLFEAYTASGFGFEPLELAGVAAVLGLVDICLGTVIYRLRPTAEE